MKQFWTTVLGAFVGTFAGLLIMSVLSVISFIIMIAAMVGSFSTEVKTTVDPKSVLFIRLGGTIPERTNPNDVIAEFFNDTVEGNSLEEILNSIEIAGKNDKIKGIYIQCEGALGGPATMNEIRNALLKFKKKGKWIYAYGEEFFTQGNYYVASVADSLFINPVGMIDLPGLSSSTSYYKNMLDKIGVEMQVIRVGSFKSAVEPFMQTEMSDANRLQQQHYLGSIWGVMSRGIASSRGISLSNVNQCADSILMTKPVSYYLENKLIDGICYKSVIEDKLEKASGVDDLLLVTPKQLIASESQKSKSDKIALLYAVGEINSNDDKGIVADELISSIQDAAEDDDVKALVMRVNSPGGSAFDSEQIWAALEEFKKSKKPFVVSMGDYAASGGYYIACGADIIYADSITITGSIGIFGVIPCVQELFENKIGINESVVKTNANGNFPSMAAKMTPYQQQAMQNMVNRGYELFTARCAQGRGMSQDSIKAIAQGRVWDGVTAHQLGLVDKLGGLNDAIMQAASLAKIKDYSLTIAPEQKDMFAKYLSKYVVSKVKSSIIGESGTLLRYQEMLDKLLKQDRVQARMEEVIIN